MRRLLLLAVLVGMTVGCKNSIGPRQSRDLPPADDPLLSIEEQRQRARFQYSLPEDDRAIAPPGYINRPGPTGR